MDDLINAEDHSDFRGLNERWRERFAFFHLYGDPNTKQAREALRQLPWRKRRRITGNWWAFWFAPFYLCILGLWRKVVVLWGSWLAIDLYLTSVGMETAYLARGLSTGLAIYYSMTVNYAYYLRKVHGAKGWNPFSPW